ncbi:MAG TPA: hypothetical protein VLK33_04490 [Terriglobales bacterium]|nr:hypothetical protein [Terriglobales bacterium]
MGDFRNSKGLFAGACLLSFITMGCGGKSSSTPACKLLAINVSPASATVNHSAAAPGNTQHFDAFASASTPVLGCFEALGSLQSATCSVSDNTNVSISNVHDATFGTATCKGATAGAATVTATVPVGDGTNVTNTASLTCN